MLWYDERAVVNADRSSRVRKPSARRVTPDVVLTTDSSGLRSWPSPAGFHEAALPSSETAMNALAIPAARAPEPLRVNTMFWAAALAPASRADTSSAPRPAR